MTNPVPTHAPKTDTPATQEPVPQSWLNGMPRKQLIHLVQIAQSALFAAESTLAAERASRGQADTEQFNAGIEAAARYIKSVVDYPYAQPLSDDTKSILNLMPDAMKHMLKPSVSPEQAEETR